VATAGAADISCGGNNGNGLAWTTIELDAARGRWRPERRTPSLRAGRPDRLRILVRRIRPYRGVQRDLSTQAALLWTQGRGCFKKPSAGPVAVRTASNGMREGA
jgi:hypothetical protein